MYVGVPTDSPPAPSQTPHRHSKEADSGAPGEVGGGLEIGLKSPPPPSTLNTEALCQPPPPSTQFSPRQDPIHPWVYRGACDSAAFTYDTRPHLAKRSGFEPGVGRHAGPHDGAGAGVSVTPRRRGG